MIDGDPLENRHASKNPFGTEPLRSDQHGQTDLACGWAIVVLLSWPVACTAAEPMRILFIGNSYTRFNDLPGMIQAIAASAGRRRPEVAMHAFGGCTLKKHLSEQASLDLIARGGWDALVVQGQSQEAALNADAADMQRRNHAGYAPLAALVIYGTLYDTNELTGDYRGGLGEADATHLQRIASAAIRAAAKPPAIPSTSKLPAE